jgi:hypothetical protein
VVRAYVAIEEESKIGKPDESGDKAEERNCRRISDEKERRLALVKREARKVPMQWDEK